MVELFSKYPKLTGIFGLVIALVFANLAVLSLRETLRLPSEPQRVSVSELPALAPKDQADNPWVLITDGRLDCESLRYHKVGDDERTQIVLTDANETIIVVIEFGDRLTCAEITPEKLSGLISQMSDRRYARFRELNQFDLSRYKNPTVFMDLCAFCGRGNSQLGIVVGAVMAVVGLSLYPLALREHKKRYAGKEQEESSPEQQDHAISPGKRK